MNFMRARLPHLLPFVLVAGIALVPVGCGNEEGVTKTEVPKQPGSQPGPASGGATTGAYRILGAMFPSDNPQWFIKFPGPTMELDKFEADFDKILASLSFPPNGDPQFAVPDGWKRGPGRQFVFATIRTPDDKYEISISPAMGSVQSNLKRWASDPGQLGGKFDPADIPKVTKVIDAKGVKGLRADLRGPNNPASKGGPMMGGK